MTTSHTSGKIILGIDPGTNILGYGAIKVTGSRTELIEMGVLRMDKIRDPAVKLKNIFEGMLAVIERILPDEMAIEDPFFGKNVQSMLKLGRAQGVSIAAALSHGIPVKEYSPRKIKMSVTGNGNASKEQVAAMLKNIFGFDNTPRFLDSTDALAVALCHHFQSKGMKGSSKKFSGWDSFLSANPGRVDAGKRIAGRKK